MLKKDLVIGILGGMGTYATINLFEQYAKSFLAEKEWDRPRIIIDNNCTMPSRVRAILYNENVDVLVEQMADSIKNLIMCGANRIILDCNTSHLFLPGIFEIVPEAKEKVVNIIDSTVDEIANQGLSDVYLLASEGTIDSGVYSDKLYKCNINCKYPSKDEYQKLRFCIESVKQNKYSNTTKTYFADLINENCNIILGCTELPILMEKYRDLIKCDFVFDPIKIALSRIKDECDGEV